MLNTADPTFFDSDQYYIPDTQRYAYATKDDIDDFDHHPEYEEWVEPDTGRTFIRHLDSKGNILESKFKSTRYNYDLSKRVYHHLSPTEDPAHLYDTYDGKLHVVRDTQEFTAALESHYRWLETRGEQGHRLELAPEFNWKRIQQLEPQKDGTYKDVTVKTIKQQLFQDGFLLTDRSPDEVQQDQTQEKQIQARLQKQADQSYAKAHKKQFPKGKKVPEGIGTVDPEELQQEITEYYLTKKQIPLNLSYADLSQQKIDSYDFSDVDLTGTTLQSAELSNCQFQGTNFSEADLEDAEIESSDFTRANLSKTNLANTALLNSTLSQTNFSKAKLSKTDFSKSKLEHPIGWNPHWNNYALNPQTKQVEHQNGYTVNAPKLNQESVDKSHLPKLSQEELTTIMESAHKKGQRPNLSGYNLSGLDFSQYAKLYHNDLSNINFNGSDLTGCDFTGLRISNCDFSDCTIEHCNFNNTICLRTSFDRTMGENATFDCAYMTAATFNGAEIPFASFDQTTLNAVQFRGTNLQNSAFTSVLGQGNQFEPLAVPSSDGKPTQPQRTNLSNALFKSSKLNNTTMTQAIVTDTIFSKTDLSGDKSNIQGTPMQDAIMPQVRQTEFAKLMQKRQQHKFMPEFDVTDTPSNKAPHQTDPGDPRYSENSEISKDMQGTRKAHREAHRAEENAHRVYNQKVRQDRRETLKTDLKQTGQTVVDDFHDFYQTTAESVKHGAKSAVQQTQKAGSRLKEKFQYASPEQQAKLRDEFLQARDQLNQNPSQTRQR